MNEKPCVKCGSSNRNKSGDCKECQKTYRRNEFAEHPEEIKSRNREWYDKNKESRRAYGRKRYSEHPEKWRSLGLKQKYGLTIEMWDLLLIASCGRCSMCGQQFSNSAREPVVDHNHSTGKLRGLLHAKCNSAIGLLEDDIRLCRCAVEYLESYDE